MHCWNYFLYFVFGSLVKKYFNQVEKWFSNSLLLAFCILFFFLVNGFHSPFMIDQSLLYLPLSITGLFILFSFFHNHQAAFSKERVLGRGLQYIGRRTLDVYLIHIFLLPYNIGFITVFKDHPIPVIEAAVSLSIALIIVAASLLIGNIIRLSPFLAHWVFGAKTQGTTNQKGTEG